LINNIVSYLPAFFNLLIQRSRSDNVLNSLALPYGGDFSFAAAFIRFLPIFEKFFEFF